LQANNKKKHKKNYSALIGAPMDFLQSATHTTTPHARVSAENHLKILLKGQGPLSAFT
jgi:hypothetical protein